MSPVKKPMRSRTALLSATTSRPSTVTVPTSGWSKVAMVSNVVVFPAPFGPRSPKTSPSLAVNEMSSTACLTFERERKVLERCETWIMIVFVLPNG